uniref:CAZy families GH30/CBM13 protein n=1 Tax=uncultured Streptomyces sp. TaxID=174707 RepID=A0A060BYN8_9ACTN|nr:CAZy families GH30/CBM13 protein [uncultured Streptomyces sp.]
MTNLGTSGYADAVQVATDGLATWILDSDGEVWALGQNGNGQLGTSSPLIATNGKCLDNPNNTSTNGTQIQLYDCNDSAAQMVEWGRDGSLRITTSSGTVKCIDNANSSSADKNKIQTLRLQWN